jgi:peptide-methionine (S)-S-oxide reductase
LYISNRLNGKEMKKLTVLSLILILFNLTSCAQDSQPKKENVNKMTEKQSLDTATFGAGCFWCVEAVFQRLNGVEKVISGYSGGTKENPTYREVCTGKTGHAEACQILYDPKVITYPELLEVFWSTHDPTTLNKQGADVGTQYRSVIFYHNDEQKRLAEGYKAELTKEKIYKDPIVTEIVPFKKFYEAEDYHKNYYNENPEQAYCNLVIQPKVEKFEKIFKKKLKQ